MIVQPAGDHLLLITQPEHARLAGAIMTRWQADGLPTSPQRDEILLATRAHDDGWSGVDARPLVDPGSGQVLDFVHAPVSLRQALWPRAVERLSSRPYAAALVAEHALQVYHGAPTDPVWDAFFARMREIRDGYLAVSSPLEYADLTRDYFFVRMGDLLSLMFCGQWADPLRGDSYTLWLRDNRLTISPDPFAGESVGLHVLARRLPNRAYHSQSDASTAFEGAPIVPLNGIATGS